MGMYDYVDLEWPCPICGKVLKGNWQTKDGRCMFDKLVPGESRVDPQYRYVTTYDFCTHAVLPEKDTRLSESATEFEMTDRLWVDIQIPVTKTGLLTKDKRKWVVTYTLHRWATHGITFHKDDEEKGFWKKAEARNKKLAPLVEKWAKEHPDCVEVG